MDTQPLANSAPPNAHIPPWAGLDPDATPSSTVPVPSQSDDLQPPPEVTALLPTPQSSRNVVSPVLARNSPLVPWELPSEIGYFWLGLFKISGYKVISMPVSCHSVSIELSLAR